MMLSMCLAASVLAASIKPGFIVLIVVLVVLIGACVALGIYGKKLQSRQEESQKQIEAAAQNASLLIIDKKMMKLKEAGLPSIVMEQTPKRFRNQKLPIVKAKVGSRVMSFICDDKIFDQVPVHKEVKARISGIYILSVKGVRPGAEDAVKHKKSFREKVMSKLNSWQASAKAKVDEQTKDTGKKDKKSKKK